MKCALVMTGGIAKGAFQAGVIKSFAEKKISPGVVVGTSAGALNAGMVSKLIMENRFSPEEVEENLIKTWINDSSLPKMWGTGDITKQDTIRNIFADIHTTNPFMLIKRISNLQFDIWQKLRVLLSMSFLSILNNDHVSETLKEKISTPKEISNNVICSIALTDLLAHSEYIEGQSINNYGEFVTFEFNKGEVISEAKFNKLRDVIQASSCLPGLFPPMELDVKGDGKKLYIDGGVTKNAPFGRAIKLDPEIEYIFLVTTTPITKPLANELNDFPGLVGQVYEIMVTKDIANDYRKVTQIN